MVKMNPHTEQEWRCRRREQMCDTEGKARVVWIGRAALSVSFPK